MGLVQGSVGIAGKGANDALHQRQGRRERHQRPRPELPHREGDGEVAKTLVTSRRASRVSKTHQNAADAE